MRPSAAASAMMRVSRPTERIASSLPGIGYWTSSGSQLVSRMPMTGMPSLRASSIARCSFLVSTTQIADGVLVRLRIPPSDLCSLSSSRFLMSSSFLVKPLLLVSSKSSSSSSFMRASRLDTVWKLVQQTTQPALVHVGLADAGRLLGDGLLGLLLRADEEHGAAVGDRLLDEVVRLVDERQRLLQIDDVDAGTLGEDEAASSSGSSDGSDARSARRCRAAGEW